MNMNHFFLMGAALMAGSSLSWGETAASAPSPANNKDSAPMLEISSSKDQAIDKDAAQFIKDHKIDAQGPSVKTSENQTEEAAFSEIPVSEEKDMVITNDDGVFFDLEKEGVVIYYKNIKARSKKYNLTCDKELRIYLAPEEKKDSKGSKGSKGTKGDKKGDKKTEDKNADKKADSKDAAKPQSSDKLSDMKVNFKDARKIVASGNVYVQGQDKKGKNIEAKAENIAVDLKTNEMLLTGGFPMLISDKMGIQCTKPGGSIRRLPDGNAIIKGETRTIIKDMDKLGNGTRNR